MPLLEAWRKLGQEELLAACSKEHISVSELESEVVAVVTPKDKEAVDLLLANVSGNAQSLRPLFVSAVFNRIRDIWSYISEERQLDASEKLLDIALGISDAFSTMESHSREVLRSVQLSGPILFRFLDKIPASITDIESHAPASKRRRTSQNNMVAMSVRDEAELNRLMDKMTFILELVDNSTPENYPELADGLFQTLASLHLLKSQIQSGLSYLLSLALGSLLNIVNKAKVCFSCCAFHRSH
jgi:U3 small nucleolar RNA-associated protein 10